MSDKLFPFPAIELVGIVKYFPGTIANDDINLKIMQGEVHALLGENGAGKSTLMKILYGLYQPDAGQIFCNGKEVAIRSPQEAVKLGIGMIHQHFTLVPTHSVVENIILGNPDYRPQEAAQKISRISSKYGLDLDPYAIIETLPVGMQQRAEILKALYRESRVLIMDEPTAVLTPLETERLFEFIDEFRSNGNSVIFISHKMNEVMKISDNITVLRAGRVAGNVARAGATEAELVRLMVGRNIETLPVEPQEKSSCVLEVKDLVVHDARGVCVIDGCSFSVDAGEIFGIAGVSGNGQEELADVVAGLRKATSGTVTLEGVDILNGSAAFCIQSGIGYIPEDRHKYGLALGMSVEDNVSLKALSSDNAKFSLTEMRERAQNAVAEYAIKTPSVLTLAKSLSGGNQQKIVIAREIDIGRKMIIAFQPVRGLDIGATDYVHRALLQCRKNGKGVLLISTELTEVLELSDRIGVMYRGRLVQIFDRNEACVEKIGLLMAGGALKNDKND